MRLTSIHSHAESNWTVDLSGDQNRYATRGVVCPEMGRHQLSKLADTHPAQFTACFARMKTGT